MVAFIKGIPARLLAAPLLLCLALAVTPAQASTDEAISFVKNVSEQAIAIISDNRPAPQNAKSPSAPC
ncbi:MAG: hypothetical protein ACK4OG_10340 [Parvibaculum sp.]